MSENLKSALEAEILELQSQIEVKETIIKLAETKYPDLRFMGNHTNIKFFSEVVNDLVNDCKISPSCRCCGDASLYVYPFIEDEGTVIYAKGSPFAIGEYGYCYDGVFPFIGWKDNLKKANINDTVIAKVEKYLEDNALRFYYDEDEEE